MTKEIEVLKMALEFVEDHLRHWSGVGRSGREVVAAIKEVLAHTEPWEKFCDSNCVWTDHHPDCKLAQPEQEPVAWTLLLVGEHHGIIGKAGDAFASAPAHYRRVDVYTNPPQRKPLTELEAETLFDNCGGKWNGDHWVIKDADLHDFARAIEANLNIKGE